MCIATGAPLVHMRQESFLTWPVVSVTNINHGHSIHYDDVTIVVVTKTTDRPGRTYRGMYFTNYV